MQLSFTVNGTSCSVEVPAKTVLLDILRDILGLKGTKPGCEIGSCGACSVLVNGRAQNACTYAASRLEGANVLTVEGLAAADGTPNDLQRAFLENGAVQCGYCIPGMLMASESLLAENPSPSREEIRRALAGNLCRCTGYVQIVDAVEATARKRALNLETA